MTTKIIISALAILLSGCCKTYNSAIYDSGVSQQLATLRKESIKKLEYELQFSIPE